MDYANQKYLMMCRGVGTTLELVCFTVLLALSLLAAYAIYDSATANREVDGIVEMRQQITENAAGFEWRDGMVAWLSIDGTNINYPVMQGTNNEWYLTHDYSGQNALAGSIFLDYRNGADFSDAVSVIYGHRMSGNLMFSDVAKFADEHFFSSHRRGNLKTRDGEYELEVFEYLVLSSDAKIYSELDAGSLDLGAGNYLVLSTCDRESRGKRDVLILKHKKMPGGV